MPALAAPAWDTRDVVSSRRVQRDPFLVLQPVSGAYWRVLTAMIPRLMTPPCPSSVRPPEPKATGSNPVGRATSSGPFSQEKGLFHGRGTSCLDSPLTAFRYGSGHTCPQHTPFEHQKLAEQLAPRPRPPARRVGGSGVSPNRTDVALPEPPTSPRRRRGHLVDDDACRPTVTRAAPCGPAPRS